MVNAKKFPQRQCIGCGEMKNKKELIRIVRSDEGEFSVDATGKKAGRGTDAAHTSARPWTASKRQ